MKDELSDEDKEKIILLFNDSPDLNYIVRTFSGDNSLDGRCKLGRAIRAFLANEGKDYGVRGESNKGSINLTDSQRKFLMSEMINPQMKPIEIARLCFKDESVKPLSLEHRVILKFLQEYRSDVVDYTAVLVDGDWMKPVSVKQVAVKVNKWCNLVHSTDPDEMNNKHRKCLEKLLNYLQTYKLWATINSFKTQADRDLFESEFVRSTWDKPDLSPEEINQYMMICSNYVRAKHIQKRLDSFHAMLESEDLQANDINIKLTEHCKAINEELNACEKRISDLITKLNGDRSKRIEKLQTANSSILSLVEAFQNKDERDQMVLAAKMRSELVESEANRLESMDEFKARIFGVSISELI